MIISLYHLQSALNLLATTSLTVVVKGPPYEEPKELNVNKVHPDTSLGDAIRGPLMDHFSLRLEQVKPHDGRSRPPWQRPCVEFEVSTTARDICKSCGIDNSINYNSIRSSRSSCGTDSISSNSSTIDSNGSTSSRCRRNKILYSSTCSSSGYTVQNIYP